MDTQNLRPHGAVGNLTRQRPRHEACRKCCSRFHKAIQELTRRWVRTQARARNRRRTIVVLIGEGRRRPVQGARPPRLRHLQDRSQPKPKLRRRWCGRQATLRPLPLVQWRTDLIFLQALLQSAGSLRTSEAVAPWLETATFLIPRLSQDLAGCKNTRVGTAALGCPASEARLTSSSTDPPSH